MAKKSSGNALRHPYLNLKNWKGEGNIDLRFWLPQVEGHQMYTPEQQNKIEEGFKNIPTDHRGFIVVKNTEERRKDFLNK